VLRETAKANTPFGFIAHGGTVEVRAGQAIHHYERSFRPSFDGSAEVRLVELNGDRLILRAPGVTGAWSERLELQALPLSRVSGRPAAVIVLSAKHAGILIVTSLEVASTTRAPARAPSCRLG
jgi:hypothetical protein